jgi:glycerol-3-phosphate dehydrogenase (NAD(P)+)
MGTALAQALACHGRSVAIWDHFPEILRGIRESRTNPRFLPGIKLDRKIQAKSAAAECVSNAGIVVVCVPSEFVEAVLAPVVPYLEPDAVLVNVSKGFAPSGNKLLPTWMEGLAPGHCCTHLAGPALANEIALGHPTFLVVASVDRHAGNRVVDALAGHILIPSLSSDLQGAALCGILKNSYAILLGILERVGPAGRNLEASALILCCLEMTAIVTAEGGQPETAHGLAGMGDLFATGVSGDSHNRKLGSMLAEGETLDQVKARIGWLPEGVKATAALVRMLNRRGQAAPLLQYMGRVLGGIKPDIDTLLAALRSARGRDTATR